jgi:hypothetical protein
VTGAAEELPAHSQLPAFPGRLTAGIRPRVLAIAACGLFFLAGLPFVPRLGIQTMRPCLPTASSRRAPAHTSFTPPIPISPSC